MITTEKRALYITVTGVVQGVGFRPFVYRLATERGLVGWVRNTSGQVEIVVEGESGSVESFVSALKIGPPMAVMERMKVVEVPPEGAHEFSIRQSLAIEGDYQLVSPDLATCGDCLREILDPADRRYRYPFTNCTNCGPRFTIISDIPYDRPRTTMSAFRMCPACRREYDNPLDRRFHAQPNACPVCGPKLMLCDNMGNPVPQPDPLTAAAGLLKEGRVVAIKGLGGFLLACDATNEAAVGLLRRRKKRPAKPFAVMMRDLNQVRAYCRVSSEEEGLLLSAASPIVLLESLEGTKVAGNVAPGNRCLGVMLPYTPLHHLLLRDVDIPLVMTSGNMSEEPIAKDNAEAINRLGQLADCFLMHDRDIYARYDDSVYLVEGGLPRLLRRARGYAPYPILLPFEVPQILACGGEEKSTFCLTRGRHALVSQHIGDLENEETLEHYRDTIGLYRRLFRVSPETVAFDMHPDYLSSRYARELVEESGGRLRAVAVQHHHAHLASCLAENNLDRPAIGVILDGTGYGTDGTIWGGEFLVGDFKGVERAAYLEPVRMPGGAAAIRKPYRMALGHVFSLLGPQSDLDGLAMLRGLDEAEITIARQLVAGGFNSPLTSSAGRLFDTVSALAGVRQETSYEAQAAIELEMAAPADAATTDYGQYPFDVSRLEGCWIVGLRDLLAAVITELRSGESSSLVSARFHRTVAEIISRTCRSISQDTGLTSVALSGGVFQNRLLFRLTLARLEKDGFEVITHRLVPCNDGGISLGQAAVAGRIV